MTNTRTITVTVKTETVTTEPDSWITIQPQSHYHDAAVSARYCTREQYLVISWSKWIKWYSEARWNGAFNTQTPPPAFVGDTYAVALAVAAELNKPTTQTEMKG